MSLYFIILSISTLIPLVTVLMPVYNQQHTVARAIESVLSQRTKFAMELLIGDDASTDRTLDICREYEASHDNVHVVANATNMGLAANYYNLARQARGTYIADLAGDDEWCRTDKLQMQVQVMESNRRITLCHTDWVEVSGDGRHVNSSDAGGRLSKYRQPVMPGSLLLLPLISHNPSPLVHSCTMMYRRDALLKAMRRWPEVFDSMQLVCEDLQLIVSMAAMGHVAYIPEVTLRYTVGGDSITGTRDYARLCRFYAGSLRLTRELARIHGAPDVAMRTCYARMVAYIVDLAFRARSRSLMQQAMEAASGLDIPFVSRCKARLTRVLGKK